MRRYGFFLNVLPGERAIGIEQRPVLQSVLSSALARTDAEIVIVAPSWFEAQVVEWLKRSKLRQSSIKVVGAPRLPVLFYAVDFLRRFSEVDAWRDVNQRNRLLARRIMRLAGSRRRLVVVAWAGLAMAGVALVVLLYALLGKILLAALVTVTVAAAAAAFRVRRRLVEMPRKVLTWARSSRMRLLYRSLVKDHVDMLTAAANKNAAVHSWLLLEPYTFGASTLDAPAVTIVPALLPLEDPLAYSDACFQDSHLTVLGQLDRCAAIICHDESVRDRHLIYGAGLPRNKIRVIARGRAELPSSIGQNPGDEGIRLLRARQIVRPFQRGALGHRLSHAHVDLGRDPFVIYGGDSAPHHHCLVLLRALQHHNNSADQPLRLVLRRSLVKLPLVEKWLEREAPELNPYIISLIDEAPLVWAALNVLARVAIDPSLFSPCFPNTFGQALCAWTPILMSDIPAVAAQIRDEALRRDMLFDPYDVQSLITRLDWALNNREDLVVRQRMLFEALPTWNDTGETVLETLIDAGLRKGL